MQTQKANQMNELFFEYFVRVITGSGVLNETFLGMNLFEVRVDGLSFRLKFPVTFRQSINPFGPLLLEEAKKKKMLENFM